MSSTIIVTPEMLRDTQQAIVNALQHAQSIANGYVAEQENMMHADVWAGQGVMASQNTVVQINHDLQQIFMGGTRLAEGLGKAAVLMEDHEANSQQDFNAVFSGTPHLGGTTAPGPSPL